MWKTDQTMRIPDCLKSHVLRCWRDDVNDWADVVSSGRAFQMRGAATMESPATDGREPDGMHHKGDWCRQSVRVRRRCRSATWNQWTLQVSRRAGWTEWSDVIVRSMYYPRLLIADVTGDADETVAFSSVDKQGQPAAHLSTSSALLSFTDGCHACVVKLITGVISAAQQAGVWPCWQVSGKKSATN